MRSRTWIALIAICLLVSGCATVTERTSYLAARNDSTQAATTNRIEEKTRSVFAAFKKGEHRYYEVHLSAWYSIPHRIAAVEIHGEFEVAGQDLYYTASNTTSDATTVGSPVNLTINSTLTTATLTASAHIDRCTDEGGHPVTDNRCPVGQRVDVTANWQTNEPIVYVGTPRPDGNYPCGGRDSAAAGTLGTSRYAAEYALIMENYTVQ